MGDVVKPLTVRDLKAMAKRKEPLPEKIPLGLFRSLGIRLHATKEWPTIRNGFVGILRADPKLVYHTTQTHASGEVVGDKIRQILAGEPIAVSAVLLDDDETWTFNGHHTLIAYLLLGRVPLISLHDATDGRVLGAPKFITTPKPLKMPVNREKGAR